MKGSRLKASMRVGRPEAFSMSPLAGGKTPAGAGLYATRAWQVRAWDGYDEVPESHYAASFLSACLSRIRLRLAWLGDDDEPGSVWDEDGNVNDGIDPKAAEVGRALVRSLRARRGGQSRLMAASGGNLAQAGEVYWVAREEAGRRWFDAYSVDELRPAGTERDADGNEVTVYSRYAGPGRVIETLGPDAFVVRIHRPHPRYQEWADAAARALLPTMEVLSLLTQEMRSTATSRLAGAGVYWIPEEIDLPPDPDNPELEPFTAQLVRTMARAISDKSSAAAFAPVVNRAPGDQIKNIRHDTFTAGEWDTVNKRAAAVGDFARGTDLPPEVVAGSGGVNHWGAWMIDESVNKAHVAPVVEIVTGVATDAYLQPSLGLAFGVLPGAPLPPELAGFVIDHDDSELVMHPDRSKAASESYGTERAPVFLISGQAARSARGFSEADRPDDDEIEERMARAERLNARETVQGLAPGATGAIDEGGGGVEAGPPAAMPDANASLAERLSAAIEVAAERAVDRLGSRLRDKANANPALAAMVSGRPAAMVPVLLGADTTDALIAPASQFVAGDWAALERTVRRWATAGDRDPDRLAAGAVELAERAARSLVRTGVIASPAAGLRALMAEAA